MIRVFSSLLLALVLALTSQSMAVARGASAATGHMVLCTGGGPVAVYTDAQGQPTRAPHICPDAALNVLLAGAAPDVTAPWQIAHLDNLHVQTSRTTPSQPRLSQQSRAPPLAV